jgi:Cytidine and deoxycytidylate deaminase zinc-binding region
MSHGNHPFGAIHFDHEHNLLIEAENGFMPVHDGTANAERPVATEACRTLSAEVRAKATLYSSAEPCAKCAGARSALRNGNSLGRARSRSHSRTGLMSLYLECRSLTLGNSLMRFSVGALGDRRVATEGHPASVSISRACGVYDSQRDWRAPMLRCGRSAATSSSTPHHRQPLPIPVEVWPHIGATLAASRAQLLLAPRPSSFSTFAAMLGYRPIL